MDTLKKIKTFVTLIFFLFFIGYTVLPEFREQVIYAAIVFIFAFVLLVLYVPDPYKKKIIQGCWIILGILLIGLSIKKFQRDKLIIQNNQVQKY